MTKFVCNHCKGTGFLNLEQVDCLTKEVFCQTGDPDVILRWIADEREHDVAVCDCCGDCEGWYGEPGWHDWSDPNDPKGCR